jgi:hypothetical protein
MGHLFCDAHGQRTCFVTWYIEWLAESMLTMKSRVCTDPCARIGRKGLADRKCGRPGCGKELDRCPKWNGKGADSWRNRCKHCNATGYLCPSMALTARSRLSLLIE